MGDEGKLVGREGIEPPQSKTADLQSAELTTCSTYPRCGGRRAKAAASWWNPSPGVLTWSRRRDSNPEPAVYKTAALPIELRRRDAHGHTAEDPWAPKNDRARRTNGSSAVGLGAMLGGRLGPAREQVVIARARPIRGCRVGLGRRGLRGRRVGVGGFGGGRGRLLGGVRQRLLDRGEERGRL